VGVFRPVRFFVLRFFLGFGRLRGVFCGVGVVVVGLAFLPWGCFVWVVDTTIGGVAVLVAARASASIFFFCCFKSVLLNGAL
jgi:hypothetical protein